MEATQLLTIYSEIRRDILNKAKKLSNIRLKKEQQNELSNYKTNFMSQKENYLITTSTLLEFNEHITFTF